MAIPPRSPRAATRRSDAGRREQARVLGAELLARDQEPEGVDRHRVVVGEGRIERRRERDVEVQSGPGDCPGDRPREPSGMHAQHPSAGPQRVPDEERRDEQREQVVADAQADQEAAEAQVAGSLLVRPYERPMDKESHQRDVERVDLGHDRGRPERRDRSGRECGKRRQPRPDAEPLADRGQRAQGDRRTHRGEEVRAPRDRSKRQQLEQPCGEDVGRVARRVRDAQDVGHGLHLSPVVERLAGHQRRDIDGERYKDDGGGRQPARHAPQLGGRAALTRWRHARGQGTRAAPHAAGIDPRASVGPRRIGRPAVRLSPSARSRTGGRRRRPGRGRCSPSR